MGEVVTTTEAGLEKVFDEAEALSAVPFWPIAEKVRPNEPRPKAVPYLWRYQQLKALLDRAGGIELGHDAAERRVFLLANPGIGPTSTTDTVMAAIQMILPGEVAASHRHTAAAIRFVIEGEGAYTQVGGARMAMSPGDLVLTPSRLYHDHGSRAGGPVYWLDALDLPLYHVIPANFSNQYREAQYPAEDCSESPLVLKWVDMRRRLDSRSGTTATLEYINPTNGGSILKTMRATATRMDAGSGTTRFRETASGVYHVVAGRGESKIGDATLRWEAGDTFALPAWTAYEHRNLGVDSAYLFRIDERPTLEKLGMYVTEGDLANEPE